MNFITIVEIPHQSPPIAWVADDHATALIACEKPDAESLDEALADNHLALVLEDAADFRRFFRTYRGHSHYAARAAVRRVIRQSIPRGSLRA